MLRPGTMLAQRYRLEQRVGSGGMGEVWRATDQVLGREVAVKCLLGGLPDEPAFVRQFRAEARIMATISHPGVVEVYDFGDDPAVGVYLVMKFIDGESLSQVLARAGRLSAAATMRLVAEAAEALHAAHGKGVTHRDIKPGNLLLRPDGSTLVTDFGIARSADATGHTATGSLAGTAGYIAPERALGQPATPASDVYALGVVAYRCLAGHAPFTGDNMVELALRHVHDAPPPLPADVPPGVRALVERAMAKDPAHRWPSAAALADQARRALTEPVPDLPATAAVPTRRQAVVPMPVSTPERPANRGHRRGRLLGAAVACLIVAGVATAGIILSRPGDPQPHTLSESPGTVPMSPVGDAGVPSPPVRPSATAAASPGTVTAAPSAAATSPKAGAATAPLAAPANLTATPISHDTVRLRWTDRSSAERGFTVIDGVTSRDVGPNTTTYDWTGLAADTHACFKVRAGASAVSAYHPAAQNSWVCATTLPGAGPAAPSGLTATTPGPDQIRLRWTDNAGDETGFTITNGNTTRNVGANVTGYDWTGLDAGTYMCFKVRAHNAAGVSAYTPSAQSDWVCITTPVT
ncbi:protein kinase [Catellatospora bangladeshensis]|uniref:protein kinase domain-containing protein n=1 Tax=Catellatospora bangladeshensis TaxID=310355 RepID=UPI003609A0F9